MDLTKHGFLPDHMIEQMIDVGMIFSDSRNGIDRENDIQCSTLQPTIGDKSQSFVLNRGDREVVQLNEGLRLPEGYTVYPDTRSTFAKVDVEAKLVTANGKPIPLGYDGKLWAEITTDSFNVRVHPGMALNQVRFLYGDLEDCRIPAKDLVNPEGGAYLLSANRGVRMGLGLHTDDGAVVGYVTKETEKVLDLAGGNPRDDFFDEIRSCFSLVSSNKLYLFWTDEALDFKDAGVPFICEMPRMNPSNDFPVNRASFIECRSWPSRKALEIRPSAGYILQHGEGICNIYCYSLVGEPIRSYGTDNGNHNLTRLLPGIIV
ncbi:MAG: 2'-deoxycytidine 5'-triphosphate deaminase [Candidatus Aenigmarchaeota archaeon]|nr:2'-deoxycytidine 5'-triphosphate deaminase [Candidatus Aenigmarchaeota archaeon]